MSSTMNDGYSFNNNRNHRRHQQNSGRAHSRLRTMLSSPAAEARRKRRRATRRCSHDGVPGATCSRDDSIHYFVIFVATAAFATTAFERTSAPSRTSIFWQVEAFATHRTLSRSTPAKYRYWQRQPYEQQPCDHRHKPFVLGSSKARNHKEKDDPKRQKGEGGSSSSTSKPLLPLPPILPPPLPPVTKADLDELVAATQSLAEPIQNKLDEYTGGWALNYADLSPESPDTAVGRGFLMTNLFYLMAGLLLTIQGDPTLGFFTDLAAIASFNYHYTQLRATNSQRDKLKDMVRLSLFLDYMAASISILTAIVYLVSTTVLLEPDQLSMVEQSVAVGLVGVFFLVLSWRYEYGRPYIIFHSLWHLGSALSGYLIGSAHLQALQGL